VSTVRNLTAKAQRNQVKLGDLCLCGEKVFDSAKQRLTALVQLNGISMKGRQGAKSS